jgi:hypothetical protein
MCKARLGLHLSLVCALLLHAVSAGAQRADQLFKAAGSPVNPKVMIAWNRYYDSEALAILAKKIADAHPNLAKLQSIGKSHQGKDIWCLTITDFKMGDPSRKPGTYIQGNIHGNEIQGGEFALYIAWYLTESFADTSRIRELLKNKVLYVVPTINPDSRDYFIHQPTTDGYPRGFREASDYKFDDLDGDGNITFMRWKDPNGTYRIDPADHRRMLQVEETIDVNGVRIAKHPDAENYRVMREGDSETRKFDALDYDTARRDPNRDWGWSWTAADPAYPPSDKDEQGREPFSFPETRAVRDFFVGHPNIAAALSFHNFGGKLFPGTVTKKTDSVSEEDMQVYGRLGEHGEQLIPNYKYESDAFGGGIPGREIDWMFGRRGVYSFLLELMTDRGLYHNDNTAPTDMAGVEKQLNELYEFNDDLLFGDSFVAWHEFHHPTLGKVEIGGFKKNSFLRLEPGFLLEADAHRVMAFCVYVSFETPKLEVEEIQVHNLGNGQHEVTAVISNAALMPTHSGPDLKHNIVRPDQITLYTTATTANGVDSGRQTEVSKDHNPTAQSIEVSNIPGHSEVTVQWTVQGGNGQYLVTVDSVKGGTAARSASD